MKCKRLRSRKLTPSLIQESVLKPGLLLFFSSLSSKCRLAKCTAGDQRISGCIIYYPKYSTRRLSHRPGGLASGISQVPTLPAETFSLRIKVMSAFLFQILVVKPTLKGSLVLKLLVLEKTLSDDGCAAVPRGTGEKMHSWSGVGAVLLVKGLVGERKSV